MGEDRPHIVLRADLDALPIDETIPLPYRSTNRGVSHKCGHDGHAAALAGVALELEREKPDCNVTLLFQPAEERGEGALECLDYFKACKADATYAFHNQPGQPLGAVVLFHDCYACASKGLAIHFTGTSAHAAYPEEGRNPAGVIAAVIGELPRLSAKEGYEGMVLATVIHASMGEAYAFGTSASQGDLMLTIRAEREAEMEQLEREILACAERLAAREGISLETEVFDPFPETRNHPEHLRRVEKACRELGIPTIDTDTPLRASEDFGHFLKVTPGAMFGIGAGEEHPGLHTQAFDFPDEILETAVRLFVKLLDQ